MKIALIGPTHPFRGGIAHYTTLLYKHLKNRHDIRFVSFKRQYPKFLFPGKTDIDPSKKSIMEPGVEYLIDSINPLTWISAAHKIIQHGPDLVVIPWWVSFWSPQFSVISILIKRFSKAKILFICHNVVEHESTMVDKFLTRLVLRNGDFYIVHSGDDECNLKKMFPEAVIRKSFHPTYDIFASAQDNGGRMKEKMGLKGPVLLFFGFVREYKGLKYLIQAMPSILSQVPVTLLVVGEFWKDKGYYIDLMESLDITDHVVMVDEYIPNEEVGAYFSLADLVVQPYVAATGSGVVQIAFGFLKPVIATRVGALPEIIENGKTGYLVEPEDSDSISRAVIKFFKENNAGAFAENIKRENYRFSWDNLVNAIEELVKT